MFIEIVRNMNRQFPDKVRHFLNYLEQHIEVDGEYHNTRPKQALADLKRTYYSFKKNYFTLRIPNSLVEKHFEECIDLIIEIVNVKKDEK